MCELQRFFKEKPTQKQLEFIKIIEDEWNAAKFTGTTKKEATAYICLAAKEMNEMNRMDSYVSEILHEDAGDRI